MGPSKDNHRKVINKSQEYHRHLLKSSKTYRSRWHTKTIEKTSNNEAQIIDNFGSSLSLHKSCSVMAEVEAEMHGAAEVGAEMRKRSAEHGESPQGKGRKLEASETALPSDSGSDGDSVDMMTMMKKLMKQMKEVRNDVRSEVTELKGTVKKAKDSAEKAQEAANEAKTEASKAQAQLSVLNAEVQTLKQQSLNQEGKLLKEAAAKAVQDALDASWPHLAGGEVEGSKGSQRWSHGTGKGKGKGKSPENVEKRARTLFWRNFPKGTKRLEITKFITDQLAKVSEDVEEVFTYEVRDSKGMSRFKSQEAMWSFLTENKGNHTYMLGDSRIFVEADKKEDDAKRERSVRKIVRVLIEHHGGDGPAVKARMDVSYRKGYVYMDDVQVAEWSPKDMKLELYGVAASLTEKFDTLMQE